MLAFFLATRILTLSTASGVRNVIPLTPGDIRNAQSMRWYFKLMRPASFFPATSGAASETHSVSVPSFTMTTRNLHFTRAILTLTWRWKSRCDAQFRRLWNRPEGQQHPVLLTRVLSDLLPAIETPQPSGSPQPRSALHADLPQGKHDGWGQTVNQNMFACSFPGPNKHLRQYCAGFDNLKRK